MTATQTLEVPTLPLTEIHEHPANPRIDAVADVDMVDSVRAQGILEPLMVAPAADSDGWVLIDGHRRFSAATQAGLVEVPVNPRFDLVTEAQQIEVMAVTGLQKELLSPVEEAAAYEQLALLGMEDGDIAAATGFGVRRVRARRGLTGLATGVRDGLHRGDITLTDVQALDEFADDPEATAELEAAIGTSEFAARVQGLRRTRERRADRDAVAARFAADGVPLVADGAGRRIGWMGSDLADRSAHDGCLAYVVPEVLYSDPHLVCTDPERHYPAVDPGDEERQAQQSQWERDRVAREAEQARRDAAAAARLDWLCGHFAGLFPTKSHQALAAAAVAWLPALLTADGEFVDRRILLPALGVPSGLGWADQETAVADYADALRAATPTKVLDAYARVMAASVAERLDVVAAHLDSHAEVQHALVLWDWARAAGLPMSKVDIEIRTRLESRLLELTDDQDDQ